MTAADRIAGLSTAVRRLLALALCVAAAAGVWWLVVLPVSWLVTSQHEWRSEVRVELARARGHARVLPEVRELQARLPKDPIWNRLYTAKQGEDAGSLVQLDLSQLCAQSGVTLQLAARVPSQTVGPLVRYGVHLTISASADHVRTFTERLRTQPRYLRVERLHVSAPLTQQADQNPPLTITLDIFGYANRNGSAGRDRT